MYIFTVKRYAGGLSFEKVLQYGNQKWRGLNLTPNVENKTKKSKYMPLLYIAHDQLHS